MFKLPKTRVKVFVANVDDTVKGDAVKIAQKLRGKGISCQVDLMGRNLKKQLEIADKLEIPYTVVVGKKEVKSKKFKLRDMKKKIEKELKLGEIIKTIK